MSWHEDKNGVHHTGTPTRNTREFNPGPATRFRKGLASINFYGKLVNSRGRRQRNLFIRGGRDLQQSTADAALTTPKVLRDALHWLRLHRSQGKSA